MTCKRNCFLFCKLGAPEESYVVFHVYEEALKIKNWGSYLRLNMKNLNISNICSWH